MFSLLNRKPEYRPSLVDIPLGVRFERKYLTSACASLQLLSGLFPWRSDLFIASWLCHWSIGENLQACDFDHLKNSLKQVWIEPKVSATTAVFSYQVDQLSSILTVGSLGKDFVQSVIPTFCLKTEKLFLFRGGEIQHCVYFKPIFYPCCGKDIVYAFDADQ